MAQRLDWEKAQRRAKAAANHDEVDLFALVQCFAAERLIKKNPERSTYWDGRFSQVIDQHRAKFEAAVRASKPEKRIESAVREALETEITRLELEWKRGPYWR